MEIYGSKPAAFVAAAGTCAMTRTRTGAVKPFFGWTNVHAFLDPGAAARSSVPSP
ncbi:hypothetical protein CLV56_0854 [Mumia flava]|uniref:Uncharacterized protein n=1 Tax=Mumia flava TaxID=1348852 RepID=A0A2M9BFC1_9ACTN|nr:hypothetical protein CLV56_0854 [Mumia flava]